MVALILMIGVCAVALAAPRQARAQGITSEDETQTVDPGQIRAWAQDWQAKAKTERRKLRRCTHAYLRPDPAPLPVWTDYGDWCSFGLACRDAATEYQNKRIALRQKMRHPGGHGAARWLPLARWVGWPEEPLPMLRKVIYRESSGNPRCYTPPYGAAGLLQFLRYWYEGVWWKHTFNPYDPELNLKYGLKIWKRQGGSFLPFWQLTAW